MLFGCRVRLVGAGGWLLLLWQPANQPAAVQPCCLLYGAAAAAAASYCTGVDAAVLHSAGARIEMQAVPIIFPFVAHTNLPDI